MILGDKNLIINFFTRSLSQENIMTKLTIEMANSVHLNELGTALKLISLVKYDGDGKIVTLKINKKLNPMTDINTSVRSRE
jgi:hypothetical protein